MATKYLTFEQAAADLGISAEQLTHFRERGKIRGFYDRGTWKFRSEDVEKLRETLESGIEAGDEDDWDADDTMLDSPSASVLDSEDEIDVIGEDTALISGTADKDGPDIDVLASDSDVRLSVDDSVTGDRPNSDPEVQLTVPSDSDVRLADAAADSDSDVSMVDEPVADEPDSDSDVSLVDSDSDVRLEEDSAPLFDSDSDIALVPADTDSDVRLSDDALPLVDAASDSDVALVDSGSNVALFDSDADSDVRLSDEEVPQIDSGSDSDVALVDSDSDVTVTDSDSDSDVRLTDEASPLVDLDSDSDVQLVGLDSDSDVRLAPPAEPVSLGSDSDVALLDDGEQTVTFDSAGDSADGIELEEDSGIALATESGISLDQPVDSGISLELDEDSGITLDDDSGIALEPADGDLTETIPVLEPQAEDDTSETMLEVPSLGDGGDVDFDLDDMGDTDTETGVLLFDDESSDDQSATVVKQDEGETSEETYEFDIGDDQFGEDEDFGDDLDMSDEDESEDMDVFDADDADFEESFEAGESEADFVPSLGGPRTVAAVEADWGLSVFIPLLMASLFLCVCGVVMFDLVRSMWGWNEISAFNTPLLDMIGGLFK